jgi:hypothetical protein
VAARLKPVLVVIAVLVMASLACSLLSKASNAASTASAADQGAATLAPQEESTQAEPSSTESAEPTASSGSDSSSGSSDTQNGSFSSLDNGLQALDSYSLTFSMSIDGKDDQGQPKSGTFTVHQEINRTANEQHFGMTGLDAFSSQTASLGGNAMDIYKIQDATYMLTTGSDGKASCMMYTDSTQADNSFELYKPSDLLGGLENAKLTKKGVDVNGVKTDEYQASNTDLSFGTFSKGEASFWVAQKEQYVVKYTGEATGKATILATMDGTIKWDYSVDQVNKLPAITLPKECDSQKPSTDIPIPDNATKKTIIAKMITFSSPDTVSVVADFYRKGMVENGWTAGDDSNLSSDMVSLTFTKAARSVTVMVTKGDTGTTVMITES